VTRAISLKENAACLADWNRQASQRLGAKVSVSFTVDVHARSHPIVNVCIHKLARFLHYSAYAVNAVPLKRMYTMNRKVLVGLAAAALVATMPAQAATYAYSYIATSESAPFLASGRFVVTGGSVTSITGNVDGDAITSLQSTVGLTPFSTTQFNSPDNYYYFNNKFYNADPIFDDGGLLFYTASGKEYNLFSDGPGAYHFLASVPFADRGIADSTGTLSITAVPEASTWMLMIAGFGLVGISARRRNAVSAA
jgi:hypothetical protein